MIKHSKRSKSPALALKFCSLLLVLHSHTISASYYSQICPANRLVEFVLNSTSGLHEPFEIGNNTGNNTDADVINSNGTAWFRECNCPRPIYHADFVCPMGARFCGIPADSSAPILCFEEDASVMVVRNIWPLVCLWYLCFLIFLCCSYKGRHAITCCINRCFPATNYMLVNRMLRQRQMQQQRIWNFWNDPPASTVVAPNELVLKTKKYHAEENEEVLDRTMEDDDDPAMCCTICFVPLENGDRIGDLPCYHVYHVDCLKGWVRRKNSCPLCAIPLAIPRSKPEEAAPEDV